MSPEDCRLAAAYIRVSTDDQVELSPASQLVEIRKWGSANGYIVPDEFVFVDEANSPFRRIAKNMFVKSPYHGGSCSHYFVSTRTPSAAAWSTWPAKFG